jgi:hypothetical protein
MFHSDDLKLLLLMLLAMLSDSIVEGLAWVLGL